MTDETPGGAAPLDREAGPQNQVKAMSTRREALDDAVDILYAAYSEPCPEGSGAGCIKCDLLERVSARVNEWVSEEIDYSVQAARAKAARERAALEALREWREAEIAVEVARKVWQFVQAAGSSCAEEYLAYCDAQARLKKVAGALRLASDALHENGSPAPPRQA